MSFADFDPEALVFDSENILPFGVRAERALVVDVVRGVLLRYVVETILLFDGFLVRTDEVAELPKSYRDRDLRLAGPYTTHD